jgi:hypothetical protein
VPEPAVAHSSTGMLNWGAERSPSGAALFAIEHCSSPLTPSLRRAWRESPSLRVLALGAVGTGVVAGVQGSLRPTSVTAYKAPQYWLDYSSGFVRRGFPGHVLRRVTGGAPTLAQVNVTGSALSVAAALSLVPLACATASHSAHELEALLLLAVLLTSPLSVSLLLHDRGRFDTVGVLSLSALACGSSGWLRLPTGISATAASALVAIGCASEEFLLGLLAPVALARGALLAEHRSCAPGAALLLNVGILAPGAAVTLASALLPPSPAAVEAARREARRQGVLPDPHLGDALDAVARNVVENLAFFRLFAPSAVVRGLLLWSGFYFSTAALLGSLLTLNPRAYLGAVAYYSTFAAGLSALGVDFRRWWGLGLLGLMATVAVNPPPLNTARRRARTRLRGRRALLVSASATALAVAGLLARDVIVYPRTGLRSRAAA